MPKKVTIDPIGIDVIKDGYAVSGVIGSQINPNLRVEVEATYRKHIFDKFILIRDFPERNFVKGQVLELEKKVWIC